MRGMVGRLGSALVGAALALSASVAQAQLCGDADGSGVVTVTDGVQTLRAAAGLSNVCAPDVCDVDGSHTLSVTDGVNVLRAAASLSAKHVCPTEITGFVDDVEGGGSDAALEIGAAPIPDAEAPTTISDVEGDSDAVGGGTDTLTITYDSGAAASAVADEAAAVGSQVNLILAVRQLSGATRRGFFRLPSARRTLRRGHRHDQICADARGRGLPARVRHPRCGGCESVRDVPSTSRRDADAEAYTHEDRDPASDCDAVLRR